MALVEYSLPNPTTPPSRQGSTPLDGRQAQDRAPAAEARDATPGPQADVAIDIDGLEVVLGRRSVVDHLTLRVHRGEVVAVLGRPGAGRSVLLRALAGLDYRARGRMLVLPNAGYLPQLVRLAPWRTVHGTVAHGGRRPGDLEDRRGATPDQVADALHRVGLDGDEARRTRRLSAGERRRVALARAIVGRPPVLLLDEPTAGLGSVGAAQLRAALQRVLAEDRPAVLLSTADVDEALLLADRVLVLERGRVSLDLPVDLPTHRRRSDRRFGEMRSDLLRALHIDELAEGARR